MQDDDRITTDSGSTAKSTMAKHDLMCMVKLCPNAQFRPNKILCVSGNLTKPRKWL